MLGDINFQNDDLDSAEEMYLNSMQIREDVGSSKAKFADVLKVTGRFEEAYNLYNEIRNDFPLRKEKFY